MSDLPDRSQKLFSNAAEELEEGEITEGQRSAVEPFSDGFDDQLFGGAVDRARLLALSELDREKELYQRSLRRDDLRREWVIKSQLTKDVSSSEIQMKERSKVRRLCLDEQRASNERESAFGRLKAMRHNKMITKKQPEKSEITEEINQGSPVRKVKLKATDIYSDDSSSDFGDDRSRRSAVSVSVKVNYELRLVSRLEELSRGVLKRTQLESFLNKPIFERTVTNCFVRVNIGLPGIQKKNQVYRISQIAGLEQSKREYRLGSICTNLLLRLHHADHYVYTQMDVVSNQPVTQLEFDMWIATCKKEGYQLPQLASIEQKERDIKEASNYSFTEGDVEKLVRIKRREGKKTESSAYRKVCLIMERDLAVEWNDVETAIRLEKQIQTMDQIPPPDREQSTESPRRAPAPCMVPTKRSLSERLPKSNDFDLERYMRRKYKKSLLVSRPRVDTEVADDDTTVCELSKDICNEGKATNNDEEPQKLDLYKLHDFEIVLDVSKLPPLSAVLKDIKI